MKRHLSFPLCLLFLLIFSSCGKKGAILPPLARKPKKIETVEILQRGENILLKWTNPTTYVDDNLLTNISEVEIWLLRREKEDEESEESEESAVSTASDEPVAMEVFKEEAELIATLERENFGQYQEYVDEAQVIPPFLYSFKLDKDSMSKKLIFSLRIKDRRKYESEFSDLRVVTPSILPLPPRNLKAIVYKDRISLIWKIPEVNIDESLPSNLLGYNVYRTLEKEKPQKLNPALAKGKIVHDENLPPGGHYLISMVRVLLEPWVKYDDMDFQFGNVYHYFVRSSATEYVPFLESEDSEPIEIEPEDSFAPDPPAGMMIIAGENVISLNWNDNHEEDLAGYRVWRKVEGEDEYKVLMTEPIKENAYSDATVEKNRRYYYAITAQDIMGNESKKSEGISEILREFIYENLSL